MSEFNPLQMITRITSNIMSNRSIQTNVESSQNDMSNSTLSNFGKNFNSGFENNSPAYFQPKPFIMPADSQLKLTTIEVEKMKHHLHRILKCLQ